MKTKVVSVGDEVISLEEMKNFLKQSDPNLPTLEDSLILSLIKAAREQIEKETGLSLIEKTLQAYITYEDLEDNMVVLPYSPVKEVTGIKRENYKGDLTDLTINTDFYTRGGQNLQVTFISNTITTESEDDRHYITYTAGYGENTEVIPEDLRLAIMEQVFDWYERDAITAPVLSHKIRRKVMAYSIDCGL